MHNGKACWEIVPGIRGEQGQVTGMAGQRFREIQGIISRVKSQ